MASPHAQDMNGEYIHQGDVVNVLIHRPVFRLETCIVYQVRGENKVDVVTRKGLVIYGLGSEEVAIADWALLGAGAAYVALRDRAALLAWPEG